MMFRKFLVDHEIRYVSFVQSMIQLSVQNQKNSIFWGGLIFLSMFLTAQLPLCAKTDDKFMKVTSKVFLGSHENGNLKQS